MDRGERGGLIQSNEDGLMGRSIPLPVLEADGSGITRRGFIARATLAAVAATLGSSLVSACGGALDYGPTGPGTGDQPGGGTGQLVIRPSDFPALANVGGIARVDGGVGIPVAVVHTSSGYSAFSLVCPHQGSTVQIVGAAFRCPNHGAQFAADGSWTGGQRTSGLQPLTAAWDAAAGTLTISGAGSGTGGGGSGGGGGDDEGDDD